MNVRDAILKAADHIERNPQAYNFWKTDVPDCGTPGCMLGWIAASAGQAVGRPFNEISILGVDSSVFYERIYAASGSFACALTGETAPRALRLYADKYHPAEPKDDSGAFTRFMDKLDLGKVAA
jgi:hypothetical protein